jgi:transposase-like protein
VKTKYKNNLNAYVDIDATVHSIKGSLDRAFNDENSIIIVDPVLPGVVPKETLDYIKCPKCQSSSIKKKGKVKESGRQRYLCKDCKRSFTIQLKSIDIDGLFDLLYFEQNKDRTHMLLSQNRKMLLSKSSSKYRTCFNQLTYEYERLGIPIEECIAVSFKETNNMIDRSEEKHLNKQKDNWFALSNVNDGDVSYELIELNRKMVLHHNFEFKSQQDMKYPLLYCSRCESTHIVRHGFNHTPRRQIRCLECAHISVIKLDNILTKGYVEKYLRRVMQNETEDEEIIEEFLTDMLNDFYNKEFYTYLEEVVSRQIIITYFLKSEIVRLFLEIQKCRIIEMRGQFDDFLVLHHIFISDLSRMFCLGRRRLTLIELRFPLLFDWKDQVKKLTELMFSNTDLLSD